MEANRMIVDEKMQGNKVQIERVLLIYPFAIQKNYSFDVVRKGGQMLQAPIGLGHIASYAQMDHPDIQTEVFDANAMAVKHILANDDVTMDDLWSMVRDYVEEYQPDVIGVSSLFHEIAGVVHKTLAIAKQVAPHAIGVMGGNYPEASPEFVLSDDNVEFVILSEGEIAFSKLLECLIRGRDPALAVDGLVCREDAFDRVRKTASLRRDGAGLLESNLLPFDELTWGGMATEVPLSRVPKTNYPDSLDGYPWPDRTNLDMDFYATYGRKTADHDFGRQGNIRTATMTASRGCPFKCTFCSSKNFWGAKIRYRDYLDVVKEMKYLKEKFGINYFVFNDDNIMFHRGWLLNFTNEIIRQNLDVGWMSGGGIQASSMHPDVVEALHASGLRIFQMSLETGNPDTLRKILKPLSGKEGQAAEIIAEIRKYEDVWIGSNFVNGFYFETIENIIENHQYAGSLDLDWRSIFSFIPLPGSEDFQTCIDKGYISPTNIWSDGEVGRLNNLNTENFTSDEVNKLNYSANLEYNFLRNRNLRIAPERAILDFNRVIEFVPDHAIAIYCRGLAEANMGMKATALESFQHAAKIVKDSAKSNTKFGGDKGAPVSIQWQVFFDKFKIDIDASIRDNQLVDVGQKFDPALEAIGAGGAKNSGPLRVHWREQGL